MSDPFSIIAGVCGLAVQIVDTGLKIKTLYEQFDGAPSSLADTIDLIQLHAADLNPTIPLGDQADIPLQTATVLAVSKAYCQKVLEELQGVAGELRAQLEKAQDRGRARRRLATLKIVLKKDVLAQHETRLTQASGLLMQAKLSYIITLVQQLRVEIRTPDASISRYLPDTEQRQLPGPLMSGSGQVTTGHTTASKIRFSSQQSRLWPSPLLGLSRRIGLAQLTGCVEIHLPARRCRCPHCPDGVKNAQHPGNDHFWLRLWLPQWICNLVVETAIIHSTRGWLYHMATRRVLGSEVSCNVRRAINAGDIPRLRRLFQTREVAPRDLLSRGEQWEPEETLLQWSIMRRKWAVAAFLLDCGAEAGTLIVLREQPNLASHLLRPRASFEPKWYIFVWCIPSATFCTERRIFSPQDRRLQACQAALDSTLDEDDFLYDGPTPVSQRLELCFMGLQPSLWVVGKVKRLLEGVMDTSQACGPERYETYLQVIRQMTWNFAHMWCQAPEVFAAYRALFGELVCKEMREYYGDITLEILHDCPRMLCGFWADDDSHYERRAGCVDQVIHDWFETILGLSGVDGQRIVADVVQELMERSDREYLLKDWYAMRRQYTRYVRLVGVRGGPRPEDWKLWWSQPTDYLVGEFWSLVAREQETGVLEDEPLCAIPGAWVE